MDAAVTSPLPLLAPFPSDMSQTLVTRQRRLHNSFVILHTTAHGHHTSPQSSTPPLTLQVVWYSTTPPLTDTRQSFASPSLGTGLLVQWTPAYLYPLVGILYPLKTFQRLSSKVTLGHFQTKASLPSHQLQRRTFLYSHGSQVAESLQNFLVVLASGIQALAIGSNILKVDRDCIVQLFLQELLTQPLSHSQRTCRTKLTRILAAIDRRNFQLSLNCRQQKAVILQCVKKCLAGWMSLTR